MATDEQTFIEISRFFEGESEDEDSLTVVEQTASVAGVDAYPSPSQGNVAAINIDEEDYYLTIELSEDIVERAYERLQEADKPPEE